MKHATPQELQAVLIELLNWEENMGGWDAPVWNRARKLIARGLPPVESEPVNVYSRRPHRSA
jgi:hypothetical protein